MSGLEILLGQYWIIRNENKEQYYQVKKNYLIKIQLDLFKKFSDGN